MAGNAVVELVVAKGDVVIAYFVHDVDDVTSVRGGAQASTLDKIAIGNNGDVLVRSLHVILEGREIGVSVNAAVDVVFIKDDDVLCCRRGNVFFRTTRN